MYMKRGDRKTNEVRKGEHTLRFEMALITKLQLMPWDRLNPIFEISIVLQVGWLVLVELFWYKDK